MNIKLISVEKIIPDKRNKNVHTNQQLNDLAKSIESVGLINPILVRPLDNKDNFVITAGEGRFKAWFKLFKKDRSKYGSIPCVIDIPEEDYLTRQKSLDENLYRNTHYTIKANEIKQICEIYKDKSLKEVEKYVNKYSDIEDWKYYLRLAILLENLDKKTIAYFEDNGGFRELNWLTSLIVPTDKANWDINDTASNALDALRSKNYEVVTKTAKIIVNEKLKSGSQEFKSAILDGKIEKFDLQKDLEIEKVKKEYEEKAKEKEEELKKEYEEKIEKANLSKKETDKVKKELEIEIKEWNDKFDEKIQEKEEELEDKYKNIQKELETKKSQVEQYQELLKERGEDIDELLKENEKLNRQFLDSVNMFTNKRMVLALSKGRRASLMGELMKMRERIDMAISQIENVSKNVKEVE